MRVGERFGKQLLQQKAASAALPETALLGASMRKCTRQVQLGRGAQFKMPGIRRYISPKLQRMLEMRLLRNLLKCLILFR